MAQLVANLSRDALGRPGEPAWVTEFRQRAWDLYRSMSLPAPTDEAWRRTDLTGLDLDRVVAEGPEGAPATVPEAFQPMVGEGYTLVLRNGVAVHRPDGLPGGVIVTDLETALREHGDLVREYFMNRAVKPDESIFTALHGALFRGGAFVYLPRGASLERPIQILSYMDGPGAGAFGHTLVVADRESSADVVEYMASADFDDMVVQVGAVEIFTRDGAMLRYGAVQNFGRGVWSFITRRALVGRDSNLQWLVSDFGSDLVRSENRTVLHEPGGVGHLKVLFFGSGDQHLDVVAEDLHVPGGNGSDGDIAGRGVLTDNARAVFRGAGYIQRGAKGCGCFLKQNTLMISSGARADAIPGLFIEDDDVARGGHAATTGKINEDELFYLQSRGLTRAQATKLIVDGFFKPLVDAVELPSLRRELQSLIDRKLGV